jgi:hypothetical protein
MEFVAGETLKISANGPACLMRSWRTEIAAQVAAVCLPCTRSTRSPGHQTKQYRGKRQGYRHRRFDCESPASVLEEMD